MYCSIKQWLKINKNINVPRPGIEHKLSDFKEHVKTGFTFIQTGHLLVSSHVGNVSWCIY